MMAESFTGPAVAVGVGIGHEKQKQKDTTPYVESVWSEPATPRASNHVVASAGMVAMPPGGMSFSPLPEAGYDDIEAGVARMNGRKHTSIPEAYVVPSPPKKRNEKRASLAKATTTTTTQQENQTPARMPEPTIPSTFHHTAGQTMPSPHVFQPFLTDEPPILLPAANIQNMAMRMPEPMLPPEIALLPPNERVGGQQTSSTSMPTLPPAQPMMMMTTATATTSGATPFPTISVGAIVPPSTYDPDSLPPPQWTMTETPLTTVMQEGTRYDDEIDASTVVDAPGSVLKMVASILQRIPRLERKKMTREQLAEIVFQAVEGSAAAAAAAGTSKANERVGRRSGVVGQQDEGQLPYTGGASTFQQLPVMGGGGPQDMAYQEGGYVDTAGIPIPIFGLITDTEWFCSQGGGTLPYGWSAHFDHATGSWYFCDYTTYPPTTTWQDPRTVLGRMMPSAEYAAKPMLVQGSCDVGQSAPTLAPIASAGFPVADDSAAAVQAPALTRQEADYMVSQFIAFEAQQTEARKEKKDDKGLSHSQSKGRSVSGGPVTNEIQREDREAKEIERAMEVTQSAARKADEAIKKGDVKRYQSAQEEMIRARGVLDRISRDALIRRSMISPPLDYYQGPTRGFDQDPLYSKPRTHYTNNKLPGNSGQIQSQQAGAASIPMAYPVHLPDAHNPTSFAHRVMGKLIKPKGSSNAQPMYPGTMTSTGGYGVLPGGGTAWPPPPPPLPLLPHGTRFQPSLTTPTPYSMPEFCFAWDMLLRSRRDPYTAAAMRY